MPFSTPELVTGIAGAVVTVVLIFREAQRKLTPTNVDASTQIVVPTPAASPELDMGTMRRLLNKIETLEVKVAEGEKRIEKLEERLTGRDRRIETLEATIDSLHLEIEDRDRTIAGLSQKLLDAGFPG